MERGRANDWTSVHFITGLSINAGGREMYDALLADGRVATRGEIMAMLGQHADFKLMIEGHTDNTGQAASNQTLSEKRAATIKAHLASQGIAASRLDSRGPGQTKPAVTNGTPEGRQQTQQVELVKI